MEVYPLSWIFYLTFIFLTAFVFLNMMIGVVLDAMQREQNQYDQERDDTEAEEVHSIKAELSEVNVKLDKLHLLLEQQSIQAAQKP
jgi:voltage-gated sodium channel